MYVCMYVCMYVLHAETIRNYEIYTPIVSHQDMTDVSAGCKDVVICLHTHLCYAGTLIEA